MTLVAAHTRPSLARRMRESYVLAAIFALEEWANACVSVTSFEDDVRRNGCSARHGRAIMRRDFWAVEAERLESIAEALEGMA